MQTITKQLEISRQTLLDLSTRNRLISIPPNAQHAKIIEVVDEKTTEIFRLLVKEEKSLTFLPAREKEKEIIPSDPQTLFEKDADTGTLPQPDDDDVDVRGVAKRHADHRLQTLLTSEGLQKRLLSLYYDAATFEEEQGINILYLTMGMLKWREAENSEVERHAPLILIPVSLERGSAAEKFKIKWRHEDPAANLSLQAKMKADFGVSIPDLPEDDDLDISAYMASVQAAVSSKTSFELITDRMILGFFSFAKFLMYRDLDPANWPEGLKLDQHPLIRGLMQDGFPATKEMIEEDANVDEHISSERIFHVVDADGSQTLAIEEVRRGRNLVIQGPPGTGKSQTITNIIASAVSDGKKVLFVSEKMAALEVVKRRMTNIGLGPLCLELHSSKSNKRSVLEDLKSTRDLGRPAKQDGESALNKIKSLREKLNNHAIEMHKKHSFSGLTPYQIIGHLVHLREQGIESGNFSLEGSETWSFAEKEEKKDMLVDIVSRIEQIGVPSQSVWRGADRPALLPREAENLRGRLQELKAQLCVIQETALLIEKTFPAINNTLTSFVIATQVSAAAAALPEVDVKCLRVSAWITDLGKLSAIADEGQRFSTLRQELSSKITEGAWDTQLDLCRQNIAAHGGSFFKFLNSDYRQSIRLLKSILKEPVPKSNPERLNLLDKILSAQRLKKSIQDFDAQGKEAFGSLWLGLQSDWHCLHAIIHWRQSLQMDMPIPDFLSYCSHIHTKSEWKQLANRAQSECNLFFSIANELMNNLGLSYKEAFDVAELKEVDRNTFSTRLDTWITFTDDLSKWLNFKSRFNKLPGIGLSSLSGGLWTGALQSDKALAVFERCYYDALTEDIFKASFDLREFDGEEQSSYVSQFREVDQFRIEQARYDLRGQHFNSMPRSEGGIGPLGILNGEFAKKRNHLPIRKLLKHAGPAIQALKPVFMMSPLSVAQFLEPGNLDFDLLVMDEASQVEPVDALGAIARVKQIVVVGDTRQLPPTRFFSRMTGNAVANDEEDENFIAATHDVESILSLCLARGLPQRMLRWHYRSKHQSLIAVSNKEFYENKLFIVPSPYDAASGMGLKFNHLPNAIFDSGGTSTNQVEAKAVARAVIEHALKNPHHSLGVGTFSVKQRQAILDELELLRRQHPDSESFFSSHHDEPFFVKNLENIQGDERDVIFISVGYGKNQSGYMAMRFGPLSADGGERRLNVLISRAKRRCEVFSSITADDIDLERGRGAGVAALKLFLQFAKTGVLDFGKISSRETDSLFEEQVAEKLRSRGFEVKTQIGIAGFFIDIAVVDPERPGRFLLGIECDGATYHSSRSARDRDRLRQAVLEDHGWLIHRIWSTDWFRRPQEQLEKTLRAIESAREVLAAMESQANPAAPKATFEITSTDTTMTVSVTEKRLSVPYVEAWFSVPLQTEPHDVSDEYMAEIVSQIVEIETPIHENEVVSRVRSLWGLARAGARIQSKVKSGLQYAIEKKQITHDDGFYSKPDIPIKVRNRVAVSSSGLKKPEHIAPKEIREAIIRLIEVNFGAQHDQIIVETVKLFGFKATGSQLKTLVQNEIEAAISEGLITRKDDQLSSLNKV